ncbi:hypothetical protein V2G26_001176 [Clonostachys chloroleuca]
MKGEDRIWAANHLETPKSLFNLSEHVWGKVPSEAINGYLDYHVGRCAAKNVGEAKIRLFLHHSHAEGLSCIR